MDRTDTVVAIIDDHATGRDAMAALAAEEFPAELLHGQQGKAELGPAQEEGISALMSKLAMAFGDEVRILDRLEAALERGASVASVAVSTDQAARVATILEEHDAHDMWRLGEWSFNRIGSEGSGEG
jgi:DNA-binding NarL/FixJ family response regulator